MHYAGTVYDGLRKAIEELDVREEEHARNALVQAHAISWKEGIEILRGAGGPSPHFSHFEPLGAAAATIEDATI